MRIKRIVPAAALFLLLTACAKTSPTPSAPSLPTPSLPTLSIPSPSLPPSPSPSLSPPEGNPLTGLDNGGKPAARPVAFMFNNLKKALPMSGVSRADVLYEALAEGGITRMVGLFHDVSAVGNLGTIRSTRTYYLELALGHDALLVHSGASYIAYGNMKDWGMATIDYGRSKIDAAFWRDKTRVKKVGSEHSVYTSGEKLSKALEALDIRKEHDGFVLGWRFADDGAPAAGKPAAKITAPFQSGKSTVFVYDEALKTYQVEEYGTPFVDEDGSVQVSTANVLVLYTDVAPIPGDDAGRLTTRLTGTGRGQFACGGRYIEIQWSKQSRDAPFVFTQEDGTALTLGKGKSYICILPKEQSAAFSA